jgi:membrane-bound ClpP family serine protease
MQKRLVHFLLTLLVFFYIIFEEIFWETLAKPVYDFIHELKILQKIEAYTHKLHPWILLAIFLVIFIVVELVGILAGVLALSGNIVTAVILYGMKIPVAAFAFWLFRVSQDKLLTIGWFNYAYSFLMRQIDRLKESEIYQSIKQKSAYIKERIKVWKIRYLPKGELKKRIKRIYIALKKIIKKDSL